jgi:hypothetical protein
VKHDHDATQPLRVHQVQITFTEKQLTSWGGICSLVAAFLERIDFQAWVENSIPVTEKSNHAKGVFGKVLALFLTCLTGGTRFSHVAWWSHGLEGITACFGVSWLPKESSVMTRFFARFCQQSCDTLRERAASLTRQLLEAADIREDVLMLDSTVCVRHGKKQQGAVRGYNAKHPGRASHHPLKAGVLSGYVVNLWNRPGNASSSHRCIEFLTQTLSYLPRALRITRLLADAGFSDNAFLEHAEGLGLPYIIALRIIAPIQRAILRIGAWHRVDFGLHVGEMMLQMPGWKKERRVIVIRQHKGDRSDARGRQPSLFADMEEQRGYVYSVLVTSDTTTPCVELWRAYRPRANEENQIKELKNSYGWEDFNVQSFWGTEAAMLLIAMVIANLTTHLNRHVLHVAGEPVAQMRTLRNRVLAIPAIFGSAAGRPMLRLGVQSEKLQQKIRLWLQQIQQLALRLVHRNAIGTAPPSPA